METGWNMAAEEQAQTLRKLLLTLSTTFPALMAIKWTRLHGDPNLVHGEVGGRYLGNTTRRAVWRAASSCSCQDRRNSEPTCNVITQFVYHTELKVVPAFPLYQCHIADNQPHAGRTHISACRPRLATQVAPPTSVWCLTISSSQFPLIFTF